MPALQKKPSKKPKPTSGATVACWEDDPGEPREQPPRQPIVVAAPNLSATPLPFKIGGTAPAPQVYQAGTPSFRFFSAASALRRTADFWGAIVPPGTQWKLGKTLPVILDDGVDLNAFYTRGDFQDAPGLHFFHATVGSQTFFSGESPDVVCRSTPPTPSPSRRRTARSPRSREPGSSSSDRAVSRLAGGRSGAALTDYG